MGNKFLVCILLLLKTSICFACLSSTGEGSLLCVGTYPLSSVDKLVLLGIDGRAGTSQTTQNFSKLGFVGEGMDQLDPKFLLAVNSEGVKWIYSFEIPAPVTDEDVLFPPRLMDCDYTKSRAIARFIVTTVLKFGARTLKFTGIPLIGLPLNGVYLISKQRQNLRDREGAQLSEWIHMALPPYNQFPEFKAALSNDSAVGEHFLKKMGSDLLIRYHPKSKFRGLFVHRGHPVSFYTSFRDFLVAQRMKALQEFFNHQSKKGLVVEPLGTEMALVFINLREKKLPKKLLHTIEKHMGSQFLKEKRASSLRSGKDSLIPYYIMSFSNPRGPVDLMYFMNPTKSLHRVRKKAVLKLAKDVGSSVLPSGPILGPVLGTVTTLVDFGMKLAVKKGAFPQLLKRVESYGLLRALTETRSIDFSNFRNIAFEVFRKNLEHFEVSPDLISQFEKQMGTPQQSAAINDILTILATENEVRGRFLLANFGENKIKPNIELSSVSRSRNYLSNRMGAFMGPESVVQVKFRKDRLTKNLGIFIQNSTLVRNYQQNLFEKEPDIVDMSAVPIDIGSYFSHP